MEQSTTDLLTIMRELTEVPGVSGFEKPVRQVMQHYLTSFGPIITDGLGGIACRKEGGSTDANTPTIMIAGHMDEVGFMVSRITKEGFLKFQTIGGWFDQVLLAHRVEVVTQNGSIIGVIGAKPPHLIEPNQRDKVVKIKDMFIDIGASSSDEVHEWGVRPGDSVVPVSPFTAMHNEKMLLTKAWDNRIGCALVLEVLRQLKDVAHPNVVYGVGTVQEEVGLRGAETMSNVVKPEIGFALETSPAGDIPSVSDDESEVALQKGPVLTLQDRSMIGHPALRRFVAQVGEEEGIDLQIRTSAGGTDAGKIHLHGTGVPSLVVSVPTRYIHSHNAILHIDDVVQTAKLMVAVIKRLDRATITSLLDG